jgi:hypothetical protein
VQGHRPDFADQRQDAFQSGVSALWRHRQYHHYVPYVRW